MRPRGFGSPEDVRSRRVSPSVQLFSSPERSRELQQVVRPLVGCDVHLARWEDRWMLVITLVVRGLACTHTVGHTCRVKKISALNTTTPIEAQCF